MAIGLGFTVGLLSGMGKKQIVTIAIEIASQNSGLSSGLAKTHFPSLASATVPGALYSMWQNLPVLFWRMSLKSIIFNIFGICSRNTILF